MATAIQDLDDDDAGAVKLNMGRGDGDSKTTVDAAMMSTSQRRTGRSDSDGAGESPSRAGKVEDG
jgi:hypothetical protein